MRIRKDIDCLTSDELHDLREAYQALYDLPASDPQSYHALASLHGGPAVVPGGPTDGYCIHGTPGFLSWHRAYLLAFEDALARVKCGVTLPYWDWSSGPNNGVPAACQNPTYVNRQGQTVPNPLYSAPGRNGPTTRAGNANTVSLDSAATAAQNALNAPDETSFSQQIYGPHGTVHVLVGGDMGYVPTAGFEPVFWMHHANVDRLWDRWQRNHPGPMSAGEAATVMDPFTQAYTQQWQTGSAMRSVSDLGYVYRTFCFFFPLPFKWPLLVEIKPWLRERLTTAQLIVRSDTMQQQPTIMEVHVGDEERKQVLLAGSAGFMGHPHEVKQVEAEAVMVRETDGGHGGHAHGGHAHDAEAKEAEVSGGRMLVRQEATVSHGGETHWTPKTAAITSPTGGFATSIEMASALRDLDDDLETVAIHLKVQDAEGRKLQANKFRNTGIELVID